jgi:hypothetical protein
MSSNIVHYIYIPVSKKHDIYGFYNIGWPLKNSFIYPKPNSKYLFIAIEETSELLDDSNRHETLVLNNNNVRSIKTLTTHDKIHRGVSKGSHTYILNTYRDDSVKRLKIHLRNNKEPLFITYDYYIKDLVNKKLLGDKI